MATNPSIISESFDVQGPPIRPIVILLCVHWYLAYNLSLRELEEIMAERSIAVDHTTIHRWIVRYSPLLLERHLNRTAASRRFLSSVL